MKNSHFSHILFDLDGTITDSKEGIFNSILYSLKKMGIKDHRKDEFTTFIGPPLLYTFKKRYKLSDQDAQKAVRFYREYFSEKGILENRLYDGIEDLLHSLKDADKKLYIATAKPHIFAVRILEHFKLTPYFSYILGANLDGSRSGKKELIESVLNTIKGYHGSDTVMIGDRNYDIEGARQSGIHSIGVLWGYGNKTELTRASPDLLAESVPDLRKLLLDHR